MAPKIDEEEIKDKIQHALLKDHLERIEESQLQILSKMDAISKSINDHDGIVARIKKLEDWRSTIAKVHYFLGSTTIVALIGAVVRYLFIK